MRADGVERLGGQRQLQLGQPAEQLAGPVQPQLHVEGAIQVRVVDEALPADRGAWLLKVDPHDNVESVLIGVMQRFESGCVLFGGVHVVDGAGTTDHQQAVITTVDDVGDGIAGPLHECQRAIGDGQFLLELGRRDHHLFGLDMDVVQGISLHVLILSTVSSQLRRPFIFVYTSQHFVTQPPPPYQLKTNNQVKLADLFADRWINDHKRDPFGQKVVLAICSKHQNRKHIITPLLVSLASRHKKAGHLAPLAFPCCSSFIICREP